MNMRRLLVIGVLVLGPCIGGCASGDTRPEPDAISRLAPVRDQVARGRYAEARTVLIDMKRELAEEDERAEAALLLGDCHKGLGEYGPAIDAYHQSRNLNGGRNRDFAHRSAIGIADCHQAQRNWIAAERYLEEAVSTAPNSHERDRALVKAGYGAEQQAAKEKARDYLVRVQDTSVVGYRDLATRVGVPGTGATAMPVVRDAPRPAAPKDPGAPKIHDRSEWNPRPMKRGKDSVELLGKPRRITIHHGGDRIPDPPVSRDDAVKRMHSYQDTHQAQKHWADIGYHFVIDGAGRIWEGRDIKWQGAHAGSKALNDANIGICLMGNLDRVQPTAAQKASLKQLTVWLVEKYSIPLAQVDGHGEVKDTNCPGRYTEAYIKVMLKELAPAKGAKTAKK